MSINISVPNDTDTPELKPRITVLGVGGAGGNAVNNMISKDLQGVDFVVANTDAQALIRAKTDRRVQLGADVTEGLGAGSRPDVGRVSAEESLDRVMAELEGSHMVFVAAGMGGGTGTGAAPVIARAAKERGILTVAVVTKPFQFEGAHRMRIAEAGIQDLESFVDTLIIIPNQNLFRIANEHTTFADAFGMADEVLYSGVRGVTDLMVMPGLINLDFADIRAVMGEMGKAMMGTGEASGERRALEAAEAAINNPLLDDSSMKGAKGVLINITGGMDITLFEVDEAANRIRSEVDPDAHIIIGSAFDKELDGLMRVSVVATGIDQNAAVEPRPQILTVSAAAPKPAPKPMPKSVAAAPKPAAAVVEAPAPAVAATPVETVEETMEGDVEGFEIADPEVAEVEEAPLEVAVAEETVPEVEAVAETEEPEAEPEPVVEAAARVEAPLPATPKLGAKDAFIPKRPAGEAEDIAKKSDPLAEAAIVNGGRAPAAKPEGGRRGGSLFELVTGTGRAALGRMTGQRSEPEAAPPVSTPTSEPKAERTLTATGSSSMPAPAAIAVTGHVAGHAGGHAAGQATAQDRLAGLDPEDRIKESAAEDLLDIPAFLRRQAN